MYIALILDHLPTVAHDKDEDLSTLKTRLESFKKIGCIYNTEIQDFEVLNSTNQKEISFIHKRIIEIVNKLGL